MKKLIAFACVAITLQGCVKSYTDEKPVWKESLQKK